MKIDEAIKILANDLIPNYPYAINPKARAIQLGIEALKRVKGDRQNYRIPYSPEMLPGENTET